jgi:ATP-dependent helicase/nuclease subunit A
MEFLLQDLKRQAAELRVQMEDACDTCRNDEFLCAYEPAFSEDVFLLKRLSEAEDFPAFYEILAGAGFGRLATVRSKEVDPEKKAYVTGCRDRVKTAIKKMKELYAFDTLEHMFADLEGTREAAGVLLDLAEGFAERFQAKKRDKNLVDFNDLEHEALKVLIRVEEDGARAYTDAADELSMQYREVLVDEYQDSNLVQEELLKAVSRERFGQHNVFMVGDVKQSIYRFRLARPELFLEKYHAYPSEPGEDGPNLKIELHQNFRSRDTVLTGINDIFYRIMTENLGNIRYTEDAALHPGAVFAEAKEPDRVGGLPELLMVNTGDEALSGLDEDAADYTAKELEAKLIAAKIREMTDPEYGFLVWDKKLGESGGYRTAQYRDMVILLRSTTGWTETLLQILLNEGIPAYAESRMGYFNTLEVETVLSLLAVIDNPMQDIPLAAVLKSPVVGMSDRELAEMMADYRNCADKGQDRGIYAAAVRWEHLNHFFEKLDRFRLLASYLPIHELIYRLYEETGYYDYVSAMPAGETRRANLDMLVEKAAEYEKTSYKGLFHFIRYIENLKKYNSDFGEASTVGEEDNTVRIMSIHKSKGLEFPIVFLAGMGKKFNKQDVYGKVLIDPVLGIATDYLDAEHRVKASTIKKNVLRRKMELDSLGEELRVLYVAMTRAKEKLIMTGTDRNLGKTLEKYSQIPLAGGQIPYTILSGAASYLDWVLMCTGQTGNGLRIQVKEIPVMEFIGEELGRQLQKKSAKDTLTELDLDQEYDSSFGKRLKEHLDFVYPYAADVTLHSKMSVSELKKMGQLTDDGEAEMPFESVLLWPEETVDASLDALGIDAAEIICEMCGGHATESAQEMSGMPADSGAGADRGTAYHRALELLPFDQIRSRSDVEAWLERFVEEKQYTAESLKMVDSTVIWNFLCSETGHRMAAAQAEGRLHKEQQFVMGIPARAVGPVDSDELVVIQGIIDAYFEEDGELILVDYKTDRTWSSQVLLDHYKRQLDYYERALNQLTGKKVREKWIYSLTMQRAIPC